MNYVALARCRLSAYHVGNGTSVETSRHCVKDSNGKKMKLGSIQGVTLAACNVRQSGTGRSGSWPSQSSSVACTFYFGFSFSLCVCFCIFQSIVNQWMSYWLLLPTAR
jgi:hypothetical protein